MAAEKFSEDDENYYDILGCDEQSTHEQIAVEYRILAKKYHPDKVQEDEKIAAERRFVQIEQAKAVLLDKDMREKYDMWRRGGFRVVVSFRRWLDMQPQVHQSMHWTQPEKQVPRLQQGSGVNTGLISESSQKSQSEIANTSLKEFRRGSKESKHLSQFRTYGT